MTSSAGNCISVSPSRLLPEVGAMLRMSLVLGPPRISLVIRLCTPLVVGPRIRLVVGPCVGPPCVRPIVGPSVGFGISPVDGLRILLDEGLPILLIGLRISLVIGPRVRLVVGRWLVVGVVVVRRGYCWPHDSTRNEGSDDHGCDPCLSRRRSGSCQRSSADCRRSAECHQALRHVTLLSS